MTTTALADTGSDLLSRLDGRLPSSPDEIREALRQAEERRLAGIPGVPAEEMIEELERILAEDVLGYKGCGLAPALNV
jgi:hypothetical protein